MHFVSVNRRINKPVTDIWQTLDKFGDVYTYHPHVKHSESINDIPTGIGAERTCHFENGNKIKERITTYDSGNEYEVDIYEPGSFPLIKAVGRLKVSPVSDDTSDATFSMSFQPKFGPLGWIMAQLIMKNQFAKILASVLEGLDKNLQTGQVITTKNLK
jgi:hypothetical protein